MELQFIFIKSMNNYFRFLGVTYNNYSILISIASIYKVIHSSLAVKNIQKVLIERVNTYYKLIQKIRDILLNFSYLNRMFLFHIKMNQILIRIHGQ